MLDYSKEKESMGEQVDPFDLTKKQEADLQRIRQFRLIDDVFMNKVFEDKSCVELLLQTGFRWMMEPMPRQLIQRIMCINQEMCMDYIMIMESLLGIGRE